MREWPEALAVLDQTQPDMFHKLALDEETHSGLPEENVRLFEQSPYACSVFLICCVI